MEVQGADPRALVPEVEVSRALWARVRAETGRGKDQLRIRDLFADGRCSEAILQFLPTTDRGRILGKADELSDGSEKALRCQRGVGENWREVGTQ